MTDTANAPQDPSPDEFVALVKRLPDAPPVHPMAVAVSEEWQRMCRDHGVVPGLYEFHHRDQDKAREMTAASLRALTSKGPT